MCISGVRSQVADLITATTDHDSFQVRRREVGRLGEPNGSLTHTITHVFTHRTKNVQKYILIRENITKPCTVKYQ